MKHTPEILSSSIVVVGNFNPAIFTPDWLEQNNLIGKGDAITAREGSEGRNLIISRQVATFESEWFALEVVEGRFSLTSKGGLSPAIKDLAAGIFQLVPHTPVIAVGLNFIAHYKLSSEDDYHKMGDILAPKSVWNSAFPDGAPGLADLSIRIQDGNRGEKLKSADEKRITVKPSNIVKYGVHLSYNDHRDVRSDGIRAMKPAERVANIIDSDWESSWADAIKVFDNVLAKTLEQ